MEQCRESASLSFRRSNEKTFLNVDSFLSFLSMVCL